MSEEQVVFRAGISYRYDGESFVGIFKTAELGLEWIDVLRKQKLIGVTEDTPLLHEEDEVPKDHDAVFFVDRITVKESVSIPEFWK